jgi:SSS family solute:Na+ symporter/sodium/proline symporter
VFSALCSTADSQLLEASAAFDGYTAAWAHTGAAGQPTPRASLGPAVWRRLMLVGLTVAATAFALIEAKVVFFFVLYAWGALGAGLGAVLAVAVIWRKCSAAGVLAGLAVGPAVVVVWKSVLGWDALLYELVPGFAAGVAATILVTLVFPKAADTDGLLAC